MKVYGHRGASGLFPENTMLAYQKAAEMGADGIELDVQRTKDGQLVVFHDDIMKRTARWTADDPAIGAVNKEPVGGRVLDYTLEQIRRMEVGSWKDEGFDGIKIPLMEEVFAWMQTNTMEVNIEIKVPMGSYQSFLTTDTIHMARRYGVLDRILISSFHHPALVDSKAIFPSVPCGILTGDFFVRPESYAEIVGADAFHPHFLGVDKEQVDALHKNGKTVNVWTPNTEEELALSIRMGVDILITNYPDRALALLGR